MRIRRSSKKDSAFMTTKESLHIKVQEEEAVKQKNAQRWEWIGHVLMNDKKHCLTALTWDMTEW